jgi:hypothetical protein
MGWSTIPKVIKSVKKIVENKSKKFIKDKSGTITGVTPGSFKKKKKSWKDYKDVKKLFKLEKIKSGKDDVKKLFQFEKLRK